jgi:hypothetical protein
LNSSSIPTNRIKVFLFTSLISIMADERFSHAQVHANVINANTSTTINITANQETAAALRELVRPSALTGIPLLQVENGESNG